MKRFCLPLLLGLTLTVAASNVFAQSCSSAARNYINASAKKEQDADKSDEIRQYVAQSNIPGSIGTSGMAQCSTSSFPISLPGVFSILSGVAKQAIQQACNQARSQVSQQVPSYLKGLYNVVQTQGSNITGGQAVNAVVPPSSANQAVGNLFGGGQ